MKMLNVLLVGAALVLGMTTATAQEKTKKTPEQRAQMHTNKMAKELSLTDEQKEKVLVLNTGIAQKNDAIRNDANMTPELKKESLKGNREARDSHLKTILTDEQYKLYESRKTEMKAVREEKKSELNGNKKQQTTAPVEELEEL